MSVNIEPSASGGGTRAADSGLTDDTDGDEVGGAGRGAPHLQRSDPRERREWLRFLDPVLADEVRLAGSVSCEELVVLSRKPLKGRASAETIQEWWEYARRRGWLAPHDASRCQLSDAARRDLQARQQYMWSPNPFEWAKAIVRWGLPGALAVVSYAAGYAAQAQRFAVLTVVEFCLAVVSGLVLAGMIWRWLDRPLSRSAARRACEWLDGRRVPLTRTFRSEVGGAFVRLYAHAPTGLFLESES